MKSAAKHPKLKLLYFKFKGRAEPVRLALHVGGVPFEDRRLSSEEFMAIQDTLPFGQLPVLEVDGELLAQSVGILHYVGKLTGTYPEDALSALRCDEIGLSVDDIQAKVIPSLMERDPARKAEMRRVLREETLPFWFSRLEKKIASYDKSYSVSDELTIADLNLFVVADWLTCGILEGIPQNLLDEYPKVTAVLCRVQAHPKVVDWYEKH